MPRAELENVYALISRQAEQTPQAVALQFGEQQVSYAALLDGIHRAASFVSRETFKGEVVAIYSDNSPEFLYAYFAILATGRICDAIETRTSPFHLREKLAFSSPTFVFASEKYAPKLARLGNPVRVVDLANIEANAPIDFNEDLDAACMLKYTSGTTGKPKPMHIRHRAVSYIAATLVPYFSITANDKYYLMVPMQYLEGLGWIVSVLSAGGAVVIAADTFDYTAILDDVTKHEVTLLSAVPLTLKIFVQHYLDRLKQVQATVRVLCTSSAAMPPNITKTILSETTLDLYTDYGLNEAPRATFFRYRDFPDRLTSIGYENSGVDLFLVSEDDSHVTSPGDHGEICIAGPQVIDGYLGHDEATQRSIRDGVLHTGDFGYRDKDGLLYLVGRSNDVVNIGGEKVALSEIDHVVGMLDEVEEAGCLAVADELRDFVIDAYIALADGVEESRDLTRKLKLHCKEYLESYKVPRKFIVVDELPKTPLGKLQRKRLQQLVEGKE